MSNQEKNAAALGAPPAKHAVKNTPSAQQLKNAAALGAGPK